ncbi:hypothetical protein MRX96_005930 [Rhipicephalus microplus]
MPDWRGVAERSIRYHRSFRPVRGTVPGDDDMYQMLIGNAPVQHYSVGLSPETPTSGCETFKPHTRQCIIAGNASIDRNYITTSTWVWCFLIVLTGIISFTTTLFVITLVDSEYGDSTPARGGSQDVFFEALQPSPPQPVITPSPRNDTHYEEIIF